MTELPERPTLADFQRYVAALEIARGFTGESNVEKCLLLGEEIGELFKAVRKAEGIAIDAASKVGSIPDELADVLIYVCAIANRYGVDLEAAFKAKEQANRSRRWAKAG